MTRDSSGIKTKEGGRYFRHRHFRLHYEKKFLKRRLRYSSGHDGSSNPNVITNADAHMIYRNIDSPKKAKRKKKKESNSGGKTKIYDYFGSKSKKES